jgi:endo-1,4-beta-xylanase
MLKDRIIIFLQSFFTVKKIQYLLIVVLSIGLVAFLIISKYQTDNRSKASTNSSQEVESGLLSGNAKVGSDSTASGGQYVLFGQAVVVPPTNTPVPPPTNTPIPPTVPPTVQNRSGRLGVSLDPWALNAQTNTIMANYPFAWLTPGNEMKMQFLDTCTKDTSGREILNYSQGDEMVAYAKAHGMTTHGHTMVWYQQTSTCASSYTQQQFIDYITAVAQHYCGQVYSFDVVNEALADNGGYRTESVWYGRFGGPGYIETAFRTARAACPSMKLYYNDYGADTVNSKSDTMYSMVQSLKSKGLIDGIGFQMHVDAGVNVSSFTTNLKRFTDLGIEAAVSEMDVQLQTTTPSTAQLNAQASAFGGIATACYNNPKCIRFTVWGVDDGSSWINSWFQPDAPLLFDRNFQPKPAWYSVKSALHI